MTKKKNTSPFYVSIAGNIGSGKTTLTQKLAQSLGWEPLYENFAQNPYLDRFYQDMNRWAFHSQLFFLTERLKQNNMLIHRTSHILQDRSIYEDAEIFAKNLHKQGNIPQEDFDLYTKLYDSMKEVVPVPHTIIYLKTSVETLMKRIAKRGREYEQQISAEYLQTLNTLYDQWVASFTLSPILVVETDNLNIVENENDIERIKECIWNQLRYF